MSVLGIDIGGTSTKVALVGCGGETGAIETFPTGGETQRLLARIRDAAHRCCGGASLPAGGAVAGFLDPARNRVLYNPNLQWLAGFPLKEALSQTLDTEVTLEVDANAACLAEACFGAGRGAQRFLCLVCGTGVGGGMTIDGELLRFAGECIGDVGHVVVDRGGPRCSCGGRGCAEALAGAAAIVAALPGAFTLRDVIERARHGDVQAVDALAAAGRALGIAAASLAQIFLPGRIGLAGGLAEAGELVLIPAAEAFRPAVNALARGQVEIVKAALGWRATLIGAAAPLLSHAALDPQS